MKKQLLALPIAVITAFGSCNQIPQEKDMKGYLMVYFKDDTHGLYMAMSGDGYSFTDINNAKPVIAGDTIAEQKGIRDPHIFRAPNGWFYLAMTDLHIYAQQAGHRTTEWERDGALYGWGNNRALVLMRSKDLVNWDRTILRVDQTYPEFNDIGCAWAPEITYDETKKKVMVYYTMRFGNNHSKLYYAYMNDEFTGFETKPEQLFQYPKDVAFIDGDITKVGDKYHLFYVPHDGVPGIKQAVSSSVNEGYEYDDKYYDFEPGSCEAPNVWKRIGEDKWVLMYDIYSVQPHNFGFTETSDFNTFTNLGHFSKGVMTKTNFSSPKHGAVIHITEKEMKNLSKNWNFDLSNLTYPSK